MTVHLRLVPETRGIVTAGDLDRMRPSALFVNTSRAGLVAPGVLEAALAAGRPGSAALDVFAEEPFTDGSSPLLTNPNVVATPHLGYVTYEELDVQFATVFDQINDFVAGRAEQRRQPGRPGPPPPAPVGLNQASGDRFPTCPSARLKLRSQDVTDGIEKAPARAMLRAVGMTDDDWGKPQVGVASSWNEVTPCNMTLRGWPSGPRTACARPAASRSSSCTITVSDGISMGHEGMRASLVSARGDRRLGRDA